MVYQGTTYTITDGYTNYMYVYWLHSQPTSLVVSNTFPTLTDADCLVFLNKSGTHLTVPGSTILDGDLIVPGTILAAALAANSVTSDKIEAGAVNANAIAANAIGASAIAAGAITADKLVIGNFDNNCTNPNFQNGIGLWNLCARVADPGINGTTAPTAYVACKNTRDSYEASFSVTPGDVYYCSITGIPSNAQYPLTIGLMFKKKDGTIITWTNCGSQLPISATSWVSCSGTVTVPAEAVTAQVWVQDSVSGTDTGFWYFTNVIVQKQAPTTLIQDNAITTGKIAANSVTATEMAAGTITADSGIIASIDASKITSGLLTIRSGNLVVQNPSGVNTMWVNSSGHLAVNSLDVAANDAADVEIRSPNGGTACLDFANDATSDYGSRIATTVNGGVLHFYTPNGALFDGTSFRSTSNIQAPAFVNNDGRTAIVTNNAPVISTSSNSTGWYLQVQTNYGGNISVLGIYYNVSDASLKCNIVGSTIDGLAEIRQIQHRAFDWKNGDGHMNIGYIADEMELIDSNLVSQMPQPDGSIIRQISTPVLLPTITKAIQQLADKCDALESKIQALTPTT